jgi:hypothetical protein
MRKGSLSEVTMKTISLPPSQAAAFEFIKREWLWRRLTSLRVGEPLPWSFPSQVSLTIPVMHGNPADPPPPVSMRKLLAGYQREGWTITTPTDFSVATESDVIRFAHEKEVLRKVLATIHRKPATAQRYLRAVLVGMVYWTQNPNAVGAIAVHHPTLCLKTPELMRRYLNDLLWRMRRESIPEP